MKLVLIVLLMFVSGCASRSHSNELLDLHNTVRQQHHLDKLSIDHKLEKAAQFHAEWMAHNNVLSHEGDILYKKPSEPWDRAAYFGSTFGSLGENIEYGSDTPEDVFDAWMKSSGHRANILGEYHYVGFGQAESQDSIMYWCTLFGDE